ncbi:MAG TPA: ATP-binding protein [Bryobacteraceae bacterium]|nr:ATP-binding protein [Bryobacteraceae bacterium]
MKVADDMDPRDDAGTAPAKEKAIQDLEERLLSEQKRHHEDFRQFAYAVSHDLREPVRMIVSYAQLLDRRYRAQLDGDGLDFMREIVDATQRMDRFLGDLLTYSHQFRDMGQPLETVDAEGALEGALLTLEPRIRESGAQITHDPLPSVPYDFAQLNQIFRQLIANAITFHGPETPAIHIAATDTGDLIRFSVRDNGIGIDPSYQNQIFGVFKRLHGREYPGTGIGLAICKRIVEQGGGQIWVESAAGQGSTFYFTIPK